MKFFITSLSLCLIVISCSSGNDSVDNNQDAPQILVKNQNDPNTNLEIITLTHSIPSGDLKWSLRVTDENDNDTERQNKQDECELQVQSVGSKESIGFKGNLQTPFCSSFEIDPISTIDNIIIVTPDENLEVCLNGTCTKSN